MNAFKLSLLLTLLISSQIPALEIHYLETPQDKMILAGRRLVLKFEVLKNKNDANFFLKSASGPTLTGLILKKSNLHVVSQSFDHSTFRFRFEFSTLDQPGPFELGEIRLVFADEDKGDFELSSKEFKGETLSFWVIYKTKILFMGTGLVLVALGLFLHQFLKRKRVLMKNKTLQKEFQSLKLSAKNQAFQNIKSCTGSLIHGDFSTYAKNLEAYIITYLEKCHGKMSMELHPWVKTHIDENNEKNWLKFKQISETFQFGHARPQPSEVNQLRDLAKAIITNHFNYGTLFKGEGK